MIYCTYFFDFWKWTHCCRAIRYIFMSSITKNRRRSFHYFITGPLKNFFNFVLFLNICLGPQIGQNGFWIGERQKNCFSFLFFTFKQTKKHILIQMQPLKMLNRQNLCTFCVKLAKIFWSPALSQKEILQWGSYNNLAQHEMFPVFFLQKSLHPTA